MEGEQHHVAVDLGAGSGRVILGRFGGDRLEVKVVHRFPNRIDRTGGHQRWNTARLFEEIVTGLGMIPDLADPRTVASIGVDSWGVDYGLIDARGDLTWEPVCYRDSRTDGAMEEVFEILPREEIYRLTGIQFLPFNTLYQLHAQVAAGEWPEDAATLLMIPDLMHHRLCGTRVSEFTDATTTQLINARTRQWDPALVEAIGMDMRVLPELTRAGAVLGTLEEGLQRDTGLPAMKVVAPATHDTASAVVGTPLEADWLYLSSGTWSLIGMETAEPVISEKTARYDFTNEGGAFDTNRFLKNVTGLWILESCREKWKDRGEHLDYDALIRKMQSVQPFQALIFPDDTRFLNPDDMIEAVCGALADSGQTPVRDPVGLSRIILESMALRYASVVEMIRDCTGGPVKGIHIVGGGSRNAFLNQATADATGLTVVAGPVEATAIGNLVVQAIAGGRFRDVREAREYSRRSTSIETYTPGNTAAWQTAREQYRKLESNG